MNWEMFSFLGYLSVVLWVCIPLFWVAHLLLRSRGWLVHVALVVGAVAVVLAMVNSKTHVANIRVDMTAREEQRLSAAEMARDQAIAEREAEAADVTWAEDTASERMDRGGMDDADLAFHNRLDAEATPEWKENTVDRDLSADAQDDLESLIGAGPEEREAVEAEGFEEPEEAKPIVMSDEEKKIADRLNDANLNGSKIMFVLALLVVAFDWVRRLNDPRKAYLPLPVPSAWPNTLKPRPAVSVNAAKPKRPLAEEMRRVVRRGEPFVLITDDASLASDLVGSMPRLPGGYWKMDVVNPAEDRAMDDDFIFEALWFARDSFVVGDPARGLPLLERFAALLTERRQSRAHTRQTVHVVWNLPHSVPETLLSRLATLGQATGVIFFLNRSDATPEKSS